MPELLKSGFDLLKPAGGEVLFGSLPEQVEVRGRGPNLRQDPVANKQADRHQSKKASPTAPTEPGQQPPDSAPLFIFASTKVPCIDCDTMRKFAASPLPAEGEQETVTEGVSEASLMGEPPQFLEF